MRIADARELGQLLSKRRKEKGLTQTELAELVGVGLRLISDLERGTRGVNVATVLLICARLGLDIDITPREAHSSPERSS